MEKLAAALEAVLGTLAKWVSPLSDNNNAVLEVENADGERFILKRFALYFELSDCAQVPDARAAR